MGQLQVNKWNLLASLIADLYMTMYIFWCIFKILVHLE